MSQEYGIDRKTFYNWLQREGITLKGTLITPLEQQIIYEIFGHPDYYTKNKHLKKPLILTRDIKAI